jgi:hypothetical protein
VRRSLAKETEWKGMHGGAGETMAMDEVRMWRIGDPGGGEVSDENRKKAGEGHRRG